MEITQEELLAPVTIAIKDDTIVWTDDNAVANNYGTDGEIRYYQDATISIRNCRIPITVVYETTAEYDKWVDDCKKWEDRDKSNNNQDNYHENEKEGKKLEEKYGGEPLECSYFTDDESNNCNWTSPVAVEIIAD